MPKTNKYYEYFDIDEYYFPQINDYSIANAKEDFWTRTYPHQTFIEMLKNMERILARQEKRSLRIEGAYGTGKSQCAYALKKILEVTEPELRDYWNKYEPLKKNPDLLEKYIGHKKKGIVTAHRYASGGIMSPRDLFFAVQESIKNALIENKINYLGENTLKEGVVAWLEKPANKLYFDELLKQPEYNAMFSQSTSDEIINKLKKDKEIKSLMENIFRLADKEGVTALSIDTDKLVNWLTDIIDQNKISIVLIWDEFQDYFKNNRESLSEFQKLAELVNLKPFYFIFVTHELGQLFSSADTTWPKIRDRFIPAHIALPDNIAFDLIGHAFNVKTSAKPDWNKLVDSDLNARVVNSRAAVMKTTNISNPEVMGNIMPIHPMAALLLKNISTAFKSNQRSMFDFIKTSDTENVKAFQWFIENTGPYDDYPLLTVDMLWNFFYEKGRDNLSSDIRIIMDTYPQQQNLREDEKKILKAILIMQAIDQRLGGSIDLLKATEQNLGYVFEGIPDLEGTKSANIAKGLKEKGIIVTNPISGGRFVYAAAVLAGDQTKIDNFKKEIRQSATTAKLVQEGGLSNVLALSPALKLRFETEPGTGKIHPITITDFTRTINTIRDKPYGWNFHAVIAFAKDDSEASAFRRNLKTAVSDGQYKNILFIDALSTPLGTEAFDQYVDFSAMALYYMGSNNTSSRENSDKAKRVLDQDWKNRIYNGQFIIYDYSNKEGEKLGNAQGVTSVLQTVITKKFKYIFDFTKNLTENQLKLTQAKTSAKCGILQSTSGVIGGIENNVLPAVWKMDKYWENQQTAVLPISKIKIDIEKQIKEAFINEGQISINEIYDTLEKKHGFSPCNLSAFLTGFLLKEYGGEPFRYSDSSGGHEPMTPDKLAEMIGNYIGKSPKPTYLVKMTPEEMAFYELTEKAWKIPKDSCSSAGQAIIAITIKMRELGLPVWCLEEIDTSGVYDVIQRYIDFVQVEGNEAHKKAVDIGKIAIAKTSLANNMISLLTTDNCQKAMREYLKTFENGKIIELATSIGAKDNIITDIRRYFDVKHSCLWKKQTGEDEIRRLLIDYGIVKESNDILNVSVNSLINILKEWRERLKFFNISHEALRNKYPSLKNIIDNLYRIYQQVDLLPDQLKLFYDELKVHKLEIKKILLNDISVFRDLYKPYLEDLSENDITNIRSMFQVSLFEYQINESNIVVKETAENYRKNQLKTQMFNLWKEKTGTKNPIEWSNKFRTPILCCVSISEFDNAKKTFETLNRNTGTDAEIKDAISYLETTKVFDILSNEKKRDTAFIQDIIGEYYILLPDINKVKDSLEQMIIDTYNWRDNPNIKNKIKELAEAEYNAGGIKKVLQKIDKMDDAQLKQYLKQLVKDNITVGIKIMDTNNG